MGLGETIGQVTMLNQNNTATTALYETQDHSTSRGQIHVALLGDPTLRLHVVKPPSTVSASASGATVSVSWTASTDSGLQGYNIYRAFSKSGPFKKVNTSLVTGTSFSDTSVPKGLHTYMVRAVKKEGSVSGENMGSGTYLNMSQGAFTSSPVDVSSGALWNLTQLAHISGTDWTYGFGINNAATFEAAGYYTIYMDRSQAVRWYNGTPTYFSGYWSSYDTSYGVDVNDGNIIAGTIDKYDSYLGYGHTVRGFRWGPTQSTFSLLDVLSSGSYSSGQAINNGGTVAGYSKNSLGTFRAVRWNGGSTAASDMGSLAGAALGNPSYAYGINEAGYIVGKSSTQTSGQTRAFIAEPNSDIDASWEPLALSAAATARHMQLTIATRSLVLPKSPAAAGAASSGKPTELSHRSILHLAPAPLEPTASMTAAWLWASIPAEDSSGRKEWETPPVT